MLSVFEVLMMPFKNRTCFFLQPLKKKRAVKLGINKHKDRISNS